MGRTATASRRRFLQASAATAAGVIVPSWSSSRRAPAIVVSAQERPQALQGLQFGDPGNGSVVVWSRSDRPARMLVEWSYDDDFARTHRLVGPHALDTTDFTVRQDLEGLEPGSEVFVRVSFQSLNNDRAISEPVIGRFVVPPATGRDDDGRRQAVAIANDERDVRFMWGGDTAGQGWGINTAFGGMKIYETMRQRESAVLHPQRRHHLRRRPDCRDRSPPRTARSGTTSSRRRWPRWRRRSTSSAAAIATTCSTRMCAASTPKCRRSGSGTITRSSTTGRTSKDLSADARYTEKNVPLLVARGTRAFLEYAPMRPFDARESQRVYRRYSYGPLLDLFVLDMRSYRGPNTANLQTTPSDETVFLGREQLDWLKAGAGRVEARCGRSSPPTCRSA